jgi:hypothetical protein
MTSSERPPEPNRDFQAHNRDQRNEELKPSNETTPRKVRREFQRARESLRDTTALSQEIRSRTITCHCPLCL